MQFTKEELAHLSTLARINIQEEVQEKMLHDMQAILGYVSEINSLVIEQDETAPLFYNVTREDEVLRETGSLTEAILTNAPEREGDFVKVSQVLK
jgi:aspartyl/glutamyl-tRNA(Asn/Gln) amidotransferase C subunit